VRNRIEKRKYGKALDWLGGPRKATKLSGKYITLFLISLSENVSIFTWS